MQTDAGFVYKYFDLLDRFIRVRKVDDQTAPPLPKGSETPPDRRQYRRLIVRHCLEQPDELFARVKARYPEERDTVEDLLYRICIDVNPHWEIHAVTLPAPGDQPARVPAAPAHDPIGELRRRVTGLQARLGAEVFGQDHAVAAVCRALDRAASGLRDPERPLGCFLFVGRTGCGKTELAKALARQLHGSGGLVRIDCSEYGQPHDTARLTGAPPGYVGHQAGGALSEPLRARPDSVVLFDEVEKAHERLHHLLLQILDEGRLTDGRGEETDLRRATIILTSNVGTEDYRRAAQRLGFGASGLDEDDFAGLTRAALERSFRPELLNRLDAVLTFRPLDSASCERIVRARLDGLRTRLAGTGVALAWTPAAVRSLARRGFHEEYGARELRRTVDREVEEPLSSAILADRAARPTRFLVRSRAGQVFLERQTA